MTRIFKQPVSMQVTQEQYLRLSKQLENLGYIDKGFEKRVIDTHKYLMTNFGINSNQFGLNQIPYGETVNSEELFLSLAAMTEGDTPIIGEYMISLEDVFEYDNTWGSVKGEIIKVVDIDDEIGLEDTIKGVFGSTYNTSCYRKATKEELINYFTKKETMSEKKIIGYKLIKPEYKNAALAIVPDSAYLQRDKNLLGNDYMMCGGEFTLKLKDAGVLDLWFEPVYEIEEKEFKVGNFIIKVKEGKAYHKNDNITEFVKQLCVINMTSQPYGGKYTATVKEIIFSQTGCEHNESKLSEWIKVYEAL